MSDAATPERWLPVVGYEGYYEVSDLGRVRSVDRVIIRGRGIRQPLKGRVLRTTDANGYPTVTLCVGRKTRRVYVHICVLTAFGGPCPPGEQTRHRDGDSHNPARANLHWGTPSENGLDRTRHGTNPTHTQERCHRGHLLRAPNLVPGFWKCLACQKATGHVRDVRAWQGVERDPAVVADVFYDHIMNGTPLPTVKRAGKLGRPRLAF